VVGRARAAVGGANVASSHGSAVRAAWAIRDDDNDGVGGGGGGGVVDGDDGWWLS